ncbi:hypothetical protein HDV00_002030 [Rhizophlyctis rosea]|nr:hypothetical protein HDV00_002030 [Rhizophlyctis rosea]
MFPDADPEVCEAVFAANGNNVEQTINALLDMTSPTAAPTTTQPQTERDAPPRQPATATAGAAGQDTSADEAFARALAQQEEDEAFARQLAEQEENAARGQYYSNADRTNTEPDAVDKIITSATQFGENAKKKITELYNKTFQNPDATATSSSAGPASPSANRGAGGLNLTERLSALRKDGGGVKTATAGVGAGVGQKYSSLPGDDFDPLLGDEEPLGKCREVQFFARMTMYGC